MQEDPAPDPLEGPQPPASPPPSYLPQPNDGAHGPVVVAPTDVGAVWALVMGILSWFTCPPLGIVAFFVGGSALGRIRTSRYTLRGDGLAHAGRALGCLANTFWLVALLVIFGACSLGLGAISTLPFLHPSPSP